MFCHQCGSKIPDTAKFCTKCGKNVVIHQNEVEETTSSTDKMTDVQINRKREAGIGGVVGAVGFIAVVCFLGYLFLQQSNKTPQTQTTQDTATSTIFYVQEDLAKIHECPSLSCEFIGYYPVNTEIKLPYTTYDDLPDWIDVSKLYGSPAYISKTILGTDKVVTENSVSANTENADNQTNTTNSESNSDNKIESLSSSLINQIEPSIVEINCWSAPNYTSGTSGSGESFMSPRTSGVIDIISNYHVLAGAYVGTQPPRCYATYPELPNFNSNFYYGDYQLNLVGYKYNPDTYEDEVLFTLGDPIPQSATLDKIPTLNSLPLLGIQSYCSNVSVGDKITIFGYPMSGNALEISETVTQGIISGILPGPIYKTDAPIDHGNSGGIAIRDSDACVLGIPTLGVSGLTAGIGYIQSTYLLSQPTN
jgi:zinc-ribbon domain